MKNLSIDLKRMLSALAYQDADDYLSMHEKMEVLGYEKNAGRKIQKQDIKVIGRPKSKRIALISDGRGYGAPLDYAIDACLRQDAHIDLLFHGAIDTDSISVLEKRVKQAGIEYQRVMLGVNVIDDIIDYIQQQHSIIFVVAMPDDAAVKILIEEVIPKSGGRIPVPLVLIEEKAPILKHQQTDAHVLPSFGT